MFIPREDSNIVVEIPGERLLARVHRIIDANTLVMEMTRGPMAKGTGYKKGDMFIAKRKHTALEEIWTSFEETKMPTLPKVEEVKPVKKSKSKAKKIVKAKPKAKKKKK